MRRHILSAAAAAAFLMTGAALAQDAPTEALNELNERTVMEHPPEIIRKAPQVKLNGARVMAADTEALAEFYSDAFGMMEVQRIPLPGQPEIMMNFGTTMDEALANPNGDVVIYPTDIGALESPAPLVIFDVSDAAQVAEDVVTFGGTVLSPAAEFGDTGIVIAMVADPEGNQIELIEPGGRIRPESD